MRRYAARRNAEGQAVHYDPAPHRWLEERRWTDDPAPDPVTGLNPVQKRIAEFSTVGKSLMGDLAQFAQLTKGDD